ncbi:MAG TPA: hypothetical protein PLQ36_02735, partial [Candidatus Gracilibacteria bacterium]|nr:hypothetical protein [Candidatus Gracilibacteria bacterium]
MSLETINSSLEKKSVPETWQKMEGLKSKIEAEKLKTAVEEEKNLAKIIAQLSDLDDNEAKKELIKTLSYDQITKILAKKGKEFGRKLFIQNGQFEFYGNPEIEKQLSLADISDVKFVKVNGQIGKLVQGLKPYYEDQNANYLKVFQNTKIEFLAQVEANFPSDEKSKIDIKTAEIAGLKRLKPDLFEKNPHLEQDLMEEKTSIAQEDLIAIHTQNPNPKSFEKDSSFAELYSQLQKDLSAYGINLASDSTEKKTDLCKTGMEPIAQKFCSADIPWEAAVAQAGWESGHDLTKEVLFGIKGKGINTATTEYINGKKVSTNASFAQVEGETLAERLINQVK